MQSEHEYHVTIFTYETKMAKSEIRSHQAKKESKELGLRFHVRKRFHDKARYLKYPKY